MKRAEASKEEERKLGKSTAGNKGTEKMRKGINSGKGEGHAKKECIWAEESKSEVEFLPLHFISELLQYIVLFLDAMQVRSVGPVAKYPVLHWTLHDAW